MFCQFDLISRPSTAMSSLSQNKPVVALSALTNFPQHQIWFRQISERRGALTLATFIKLFEENQVYMEQKFYFFGKTSFTNVWIQNLSFSFSLFYSLWLLSPVALSLSFSHFHIIYLFWFLSPVALSLSFSHFHIVYLLWFFHL